MRRTTAWATILLVLLLVWMPLISTARSAPTTATARQFAVTRALAWLRTQQRSDGSLGALTTTADAVFSVALAGQDPAGAEWTPNGRSLLDALRSLSGTQATNAGRIGKALRALGAAGFTTTDPTVSDLIAKLEALYDPNTGLYHPSQGFYNALAVEGLARVGAAVPSKAVQALLDHQKTDGSWGWQFDNPEAAGDIDTTGQVMRALAMAGVSPNDPAMLRAVTFLAEHQRADGGWSWDATGASSDGNATGMALAGLVSIGVNPIASPFASQEPTALSFILGLQQPSGAFAYLPDRPDDNLLATLDIIPALSPQWPGDHALPIGVFLPNVMHRG
ncbi:MAG: terpene cyclase/mutase family protein [Anaerolineae bacterium]|nr:terpene cyclase/mutase family protein [Anaerolineae bacterium]